MQRARGSLGHIRIGEREMTSEQELRADIQKLEMMRGQMDSLKGQIESMQARIHEHDTAKRTLENLKEEKSKTEILVPLGGGTFTKASIVDPNRMLISLGYDLVVEENVGSGLDRLEIKLDKLKRLNHQMEDQLYALNNQASILYASIQEKYASTMTQGPTEEGGGQ